MKVEQLTKNAAKVTLSYDEVYILLQCVVEAHDRMSEGDISAIMGTDKKTLDVMAEELNKIKFDMPKQDS